MNNEKFSLATRICDKQLIYEFIQAKSEALGNIYSLIKRNIKSRNAKVDDTRDDLQVRFSAQHSVTMLKQSCSHSEQCRNNAVMLCCLTVLTLLVVVEF